MAGRQSWQGKLFDAANVVVLALIGLSMLFPFYYIFVNSFVSYTEFVQHDFLLWPGRWVTDAYDYLFRSNAYVHSLFVTVGVTVVGTIVNLMATSTMAYALTRGIYGERLFMFMILFTFIFVAGIIPSYLVVKETGLINSYWALILPVAVNSYYLIVMREFFLSIPSELNEAALIDGANDLQTFWKIVLPLSKPALAAFGLFYAVYHWNSYFNAILYVNDMDKWPVQVVLRQLVILNEASSVLSASRDASGPQPPPETVGMAAILVTTVPILVVYPFLQKHFAKGVMLGGVKG